MTISKLYYASKKAGWEPPEAIRIAAQLEQDFSYAITKFAADELCRLHKENALLKKKIILIKKALETK